MYDRIIIGAGLYGIYSAYYCGSRGEKVLVLEYENAPFKRATISTRRGYIWAIIIHAPTLQLLNQPDILPVLSKIMIFAF